MGSYCVTYTSADTSWQVYRNGNCIIHATQNYLGESSRLTIIDIQMLKSQMFVEGFRVTLACLYENNFDVPTADLTSTTETKLLTCNAVHSMMTATVVIRLQMLVV